METTDAFQPRSQVALPTIQDSIKAGSLKSVRSAATLLSLPTEVLEHIVDYLLPTIQPDHHVFPRPAVDSFSWERSKTGATQTDDLFALLRTCKRLYAISARKLCYAPFLRSPAATNKFVHAACWNDTARLIPGSSDLAQGIRALHLTGETNRDESPFALRDFCACEAHTLLSLAPHISYLSLHCFVSENCYDEAIYDDDDETGDAVWGHPFNHFLSATTKCRPRALRVSMGPMTKYLSLGNVATLAPLSRLTHLDLVRVIPSKDLIAFLLGDTRLPRIWNVDEDDFRSWNTLHDDHLSPHVVRDVSAGLSPHQNLECLRLAKLPPEVLRDFRDFVSFRRRRRANRRLPFWLMDEANFDHDLPDGYDETLFSQNALYELAVHSHRMPKLKLLIIDLEGYSLNAPKEALSNLVDQGLLKDMSAQFVSKEAREGSSGLKYGYANEAASSSFIPSPEVSSGMSSTSGIRAEVEEALKQHNPSWLNSVRQKDDHWRLIHSGKSDLIRIWNANRSRRASDTAVVEPTEIRVTASKSIDRICDKDFVKDLHRRTNTTGESRPGEVSPNDPGVWADPDVFTLVEVKPWLPYFLFPRQGCCCWTGELPRDSNANQHQTDSQVETRRVVYPAFIILAGPDDEPHSKIEPDDKPQAKGKRKSERIQARTEQAAEKKRQRAESNAADQAGRSSRPRQQQTLLHFWAQGSPSPSKA